MPIEITSTTDSEEQVTAAVGGKVEEKGKEEKPAPLDENQDDETPKGDEESEASEETDSDDDESEAQEESEIAAEDKPKMGGLKKRFKKLTKKLSAKDQEIDRLTKMLIARGEPDKARPQVETPPDDLSKKPSQDDFDDHDKYVEALTNWNVKRELKAYQEEQRKSQAAAKEQEVLRTFGQKLNEFSAKHDDFNELMDSVNDVQISPFVQRGIIESDYAPEIMYELAKNREEYERISSLSDAKAIKELGKIELRIIERIESKKKTKTKTTNAPEPITPIKGRSASANAKTIFDEDLDQAEYERLRNGA